MSNCSLSDRAVSLMTWKAIRNEVKAVNPNLAAIIDQIDPNDAYKFVKAEYLFGDTIVKAGVVQIPCEDNQLVPITSSAINKGIRQELAYKFMPLFLILNKSSESFISRKNSAIPLNTFFPGMLCGTYEMMDFLTELPSGYNFWNFSAGARSIITLPKITDQKGLKRLEIEYDLRSSLFIRDFHDHWDLFKALAQSKQFEPIWKNSVLYFGKKWLDNKNDSPAWRKLKDYLTKQAWEQSLYVIVKMGLFSLSFVWGKYAEAIIERRYKPPMHVLDQLKHILAISKAAYPGLKPADNSEEVAPIMGLKKALIDVYALRDYLPTFMHATEYNIKSDLPVYYSLSFPTMQEGSPLKRDSSTIMIDLQKIKLLMDAMKKSILCDNDTDEILSGSDFDFFHTEKDRAEMIRLSTDISKEDPRFLVDQKLYPDRSFCSASQFFRGCVRIKPKKG